MRHWKRRYKFLFWSSCLAAICIAYLFFYESTYSGAISQDQNPLLIAHRGFGNYGPDNGISSVRMAIEQGLDGVDLDGQLTRDGQLVIFHDPTVDRLTDGTGSIDQLTLDQLQKLDMGSSFSSQYKNERMVTFGELLSEVQGRIKVIVEIKSGGISDDGAVAIAVSEIQKHRAHSYTILSSFNPFVIRRIESLDPQVRTMFIFRDIVPFDPTQYRSIPFFLKSEPWRRAIRKAIRPDYLSVETTVAATTIDRLQRHGYPLMLWSPNTRQSLESSLQRKPIAVITDEPLIAMEVAGRSKSHTAEKNFSAEPRTQPDTPGTTP